jgi:hypothetical protein
VAEPRHEFLDGRTSDRRSSTASVPKVMKVNARYPGIGARLDPDVHVDPGDARMDSAHDNIEPEGLKTVAWVAHGV